MADEEVVMEESISPAQSPLVSVSFQRNAHRKEKFLEAEPKALGITQMGLSLYKVICIAVFEAKGLSYLSSDIPIFISSLLVVIAGNVALAAQSLHLPTLRACLGMQIVASVASIINVICTLVKMEEWYNDCWYQYHYDSNSTISSEDICHQLENTHYHFYAGGILIQATLLAISVTLAAYSCKVVNCCGPAPKVPVIMVQTHQHAPPSSMMNDQTED